MNNPFLTFVTLVQNDQRIDAINESIEVTTKEISQIQKSIDDRLAEHATLEHLLHALRADIKDKELEDKRLQERDRTMRVQLESTGSTKEYIAIEHALTETVAQRRKIEESVFILWEKRDVLEATCREDKKMCEEFVVRMQGSCAQSKLRLQQLHTEHELLVSQRQALQDASPVEFVEKYDTMRKSVKNPVVSAINGICSGCSFQLQNPDLVLLKRHVLVPCKECFRLLYLV